MCCRAFFEDFAPGPRGGKDHLLQPTQSPHQSNVTRIPINSSGGVCSVPLKTARCRGCPTHQGLLSHFGCWSHPLDAHLLRLLWFQNHLPLLHLCLIKCHFGSPCRSSGSCYGRCLRDEQRRHAHRTHHCCAPNRGNKGQCVVRCNNFMTRDSTGARSVFVA